MIKAISEADVPTKVKAAPGAVVAATSSNSVVNRRSHGMQLFLANACFLCQMYMNDAIDAKDVVKRQLQIFNATAPLIEKEIPLLYSKEALASSGTLSPLDLDKLMQEITTTHEKPSPTPSTTEARESLPHDEDARLTIA